MLVAAVFVYRCPLPWHQQPLGAHVGAGSVLTTEGVRLVATAAKREQVEYYNNNAVLGKGETHTQADARVTFK